MEIYLENTWASDTVEILMLQVHNCGNCTGVGIGVFGIVLWVIFR